LELKDLILKVFKEVEKNKDEIIQVCRDLIRIDTTNNPPLKVGKEKQGQEYIAGKLREIEFKDITIFEPNEEKLSKFKGYVPSTDWAGRYAGRPNVVATLGKGNGKSMILNGHIDTVTQGPLELWKHDPFRAEMIGRRIYGRGAADMKSGLAAMLMASKSVKDVEGIQGKVIFESAVDEEGGGNGSLACAVEGYSADAAIVAEPSKMEICCAHRGVLIGRIEVTGKAAHASSKAKGVSALDKGIKVLHELSNLEKWRRNHAKPHPLLQKPIILAGKFQAGEQVNMVPVKCTIDIDVKYLPSEVDEDGEGSNVKNQIENWILSTSKRDAWLKQHPPRIEFLYDLPPSNIPVQHPLISTIKTAYQTLFAGHTPKVVGLQAWSDMYHLINHNTPAVIFGPGDMENSAHQVDEYVDIQELVNATKVIAGTIATWCR
jgi:acetylornithine deacetylase